MHIPVLQKEVIEYFEPKPDENFIDCTFGQGGHSLAILAKTGPGGKVLGIETDPELYKKFQTSSEDQDLKLKIQERMILVNDSYSNLKNIIAAYNFQPIKGVLFDLGLSSWHLEESKRGFSFKRDEPLDMRYNPESNPLTALQIIGFWPEEDLERILQDFGEEGFAKKIARAIIERRRVKPIMTTFELLEVIKDAVPVWYQKRKIHFATKTFQALRIAVNAEIDNLKSALVQATDILEKGGRIAVISFHSLEDREAKRFFKRGQEINILKILTKKPVVPNIEEVEFNPRSRSAKLRVAQKVM